jgi:uncharacterized protein YlxW (UPF0749 family)
MSPMSPTPEPAPEPISEHHATVHDPRHLARRRLLASLRPGVSRGHALAGVLCAVLGFALVTQVRQHDTVVGSLRSNELIALLQGVNQRSGQLEDTSRDLQRQLAELQSGSDRAAVAERAARERLDSYSVLAGTRAARGPGIRLDIADPAGTVTGAMLLDAVSELRGAGAEAMQIGQVRVVAQTSFVDAESSGVRVGQDLLGPPYRILAIGDGASLARAMAIPGGILEQLRARRATPSVTELDSVEITARHTPAAATYARPAPAASP